MSSCILGKSVLLKCLVGLLNPDKGSVLFDGRNFTNANKNLTTEIRREIGMLFQGSALFDSKNVEENIKFPLDLLTDTPEKEKIDNETLGGADTHSSISGITDHKVKDDHAALDKIRSLIEKMGNRAKAGFNKSKVLTPQLPLEEIYGCLPKERTQTYDTYNLLNHLCYTKFFFDINNVVINTLFLII